MLTTWHPLSAKVGINFAESGVRLVGIVRWRTQAREFVFLVKGILVTGRGGPMNFETSKLAHFLDNRLTDGSEVISLTRRPCFHPQEDFWYPFLIEAQSTSRVIVWLEGLGTLKNSNDIGNRTRDLPTCSIVPQHTTLSSAPGRMK
jgi:hypothetical protein